MVAVVNSMKSRFIKGFTFRKKAENIDKNLTKAKVSKEYIVKNIETDDKDMKNFLFTLGCYEGEKITVISILADNYVVSIKDSRYSIDRELAEIITI